MADSHDGSGHPSNFRLSVAFIFPNLILREHASSLQGEAIYRRIDRSIRAWISYRRKVITFRKYRPVFANRLSSVLSTYHKPRLPYIVVLPLFFFPSFSFSLSLFVCVRISIFASRFCVSQKGGQHDANEACPIGDRTADMSAVYNFTLFSACGDI